jgi:putative AbiEii toxin of type IV toxin-antitoxin system/AAA domain-containing protein
VISIDRSNVSPPSNWLAIARFEFIRAQEFYQRPPSDRPFDFQAYRSTAIRDCLEQLFGFKCAYCESVSGTAAPMDAELFRPKGMIVELDGRTLKPGYWWLATDWKNIYAACFDCNRNKASRFPIAGKRAEYPAAGPALEEEIPLILDPCGSEEPAQYLVFNDDGLVASRVSVIQEGPGGRFGSFDPGEITVDCFGLNRSSLVELRKEAADKLKARFAIAVKRREGKLRGLQSVDDVQAVLGDLVEPDAAYVALQRQLLTRLSAAWYADALGHEDDREELRVTKQTREKLFVAQREREAVLRTSSIEDDPNLDSRRTLKIDRVEIENFRAIDRLEFSLGAGGWKALLGENGVGKSSVLQAVALALMGARHSEALGEIDPTTLLRKGSRKGFVRVHLGADDAPVEVGLTPHGLEYSAPGAGLRTLLLGFGSARWLPRAGGFAPDRGDFMRVRNLFNPFVPLADTLQWLSGLRPGEFRKTEDALLRLLTLDAGERLRRRQGEVVVQRKEQPITQAVSVRQLSDGYQSILAMVGDILELLGRKRIDMSAAEGVVLIDEIGAHLHPRWQMDVVTRLRNAFPNLQFLVTTHEPLCLRGLRDGEVLVLRTDSKRRTVAISDLPSVEGLRVDQLLTSPHFGLLTTMDGHIEDLFDEYYTLLAKPKTTLSKDDVERLTFLRGELEQHEQLGSNQRERLMLQAIDLHLAKEADALRDRKDEVLSKQTRATLAAILDKVATR